MPTIYIEKYKTKMHTPRMLHMKPNITYICDRRCPNCNRATQHCPSSVNENLSANQFSKMLLEDSIKSGKKWARITLTGGEPTMHPEFDKFVEILAEYKKKYDPSCIIATYTYHHPKFFYKIEEAKAKYPELDVKDTQKDKPEIHRWATYMAPVDDPRFGPDHFYLGCHIGGHLCGLGYDQTGFYCCSLGAAIARVFGVQHIAIKDFNDLTRDNLIGQYQTLCSRCGFYNSCRARSVKEPMSPAWVDAVKNFKRK